MRAAKFDVSPALLQEVMEMPAGSRLVAGGFDTTKGVFTFVALDDSLPDAPEPHETTPTLTRVQWDWCVG